MACATCFQISIRLLSSTSPSHNQRVFVSDQISINSCHRFVVACARRKSNTNSPITPKSKSSSPNKNKKKLPQKDIDEGDDLDDDAFEALFRQLEEDLKNDDQSANSGDEELSEEDLALLERELEDALNDDELLKAFGSIGDQTSKEVEEDSGQEEDEDEDDEDDDEEEVEEQVKLKNWQLKRLAYALKYGKRKTSIKNLAAELCLDRAIVLELLRDPPPNLLILSAALPDKPLPTIVEPETEPLETVPLETPTNETEPEAKVNVPVHVMQSSWSSKKRIKKVQIDTLERIYRRTKRPTNAMVSSIVHVTNLPRKRVVKWFEDKRGDDGVPAQRVPYQRPDPETISSS